ncbi:MAG: hypothetical protein QW282_01120 [Nitrososphaerales archaeon]
MMLLIDGVRYHLHTFKNEHDLESIVEEHYKEIFGEESIYFGKKKISSLSEIGSMPDGYAITLYPSPKWYVVEVELSTHPMFEHILSQLSRFIAGIESESTKRKLIDYMDREISSQPFTRELIKGKFEEVYRFVSNLIHKPPTYLIIVDEKTEELEDVVKRLQAEINVLELKTFEREGVGLAVHAHLFEPLYTQAPQQIEEKKKLRTSINILPLS